ncbi:MAG: hypothetical protein ABIU05_19215 [Nitrospirales bacterium]
MVQTCGVGFPCLDGLIAGKHWVEMDVSQMASTEENLTAPVSRNALKRQWLWRIVHEQ